MRSNNYGYDIPFLLTLTPSVVATSDAGSGIGYTGVRIRGVDASRINVTANGIPMNDAESHSVFWVNMPDFASSVQDIQVQRGVGTSTNGAGAFGASVNFKTESIDKNPYGEISLGNGSYGTHREILKLGTGLMGNHFAFSARLSNIKSDGYIDRASAKLKSYFVQGAYYGNGAVVKFITFSGKEKTYHAWDGIDKEQMNKDRKYNPCGEIKDDKGKTIGFYNNQTDNYIQKHYQLLYNQILNNCWNVNVGLHYTKGDGYYEEYKNNRTLVEYGLKPFVMDGKTIAESNLVRQKNMHNNFGGVIFSVNYNDNKLSASFGGGLNKYTGDHWGNVIWIKNYVGNLAPDHEYYRNNSVKTDGNLFVKSNYEIIERLNIFADLQIRSIKHKIDGKNDKWNKINGDMQNLDVDNTYTFFNPKFGVFYQVDGNSNVYASLAVAHKEPTRNNFTDAKFNTIPKSERLLDYELGYNFKNKNFLAGATVYYMKYKNQLVLTGELNEIGEALNSNVANSYRAGLELLAGIRFLKFFRWDINATFSRNIIKNYTEFITDVDEKWNELNTQTPNYIGKTIISYSPSFIFGSMLGAKIGELNVAFQSNFVGKQYVTNSEQSDLRLDSYFVSNLRADYNFSTKNFGSFTLGVSINNIFNKKYCSNGWGSSSYVRNNLGKIQYRSNYMGYYPQATTNFLVNLTVKF